MELQAVRSEPYWDHVTVAHIRCQTCLRGTIRTPKNYSYGVLHPQGTTRLTLCISQCITKNNDTYRGWHHANTEVLRVALWFQIEFWGNLEIVYETVMCTCVNGIIRWFDFVTSVYTSALKLIATVFGYRWHGWKWIATWECRAQVFKFCPCVFF